MSYSLPTHKRHTQAEVTSATGVLNRHRAVAAAVKLSAQQATEKAAREREKDTTLHDARLVEHYQVPYAGKACNKHIYGGCPTAGAELMEAGSSRHQLLSAACCADLQQALCACCVCLQC